MRRPRDPLSLFALIAVNLLPIGGVLAFDWDVGTILILYWSENLVVGFYNVLKMVALRTPDVGGQLGKIMMVPFFCLHFGGFCAGHGFFLLLYLGRNVDFGSPTSVGLLVFLELLASVVRQVWETASREVLLGFAALFVSHGISFVQNYLIGGEYRTLSLQALMARPYLRIVILHVAIIAGGFPVMAMGSPRPLLFILVALKIGLDVWLHYRYHRADGSGSA